MLLELKFVSAYQISLKSDDSRLRYQEKSHFKNGGRPPSWIFEIWYFGHVSCIWTRLCFFLLNFALIGW